MVKPRHQNKLHCGITVLQIAVLGHDACFFIWHNHMYKKIYIDSPVISLTSDEDACMLEVA